MSEFIYGKNPLLEVLFSKKRKMHRFFCLEGGKKDPPLEKIMTMLEGEGVPIRFASRAWFEERFPGAQTQGCAAEVSDYTYIPLEALLPRLCSKTPSILLVLDQIQDPQNLGAILRSAECSGVDGVIIPERRASPITPAVCKASAGAVEYLNISKVSNISRSLASLKKEGYWIVGTSTEEAENALEFSWPEKTALVLGSEGKGMRRLTKDLCDFLIHLPLAGKIPSLNVSASAAILLYLFFQARR
jgi:23S rRNA (guanosine2251-2'-O)-methyltransferase